MRRIACSICLLLILAQSSTAEPLSDYRQQRNKIARHAVSLARKAVHARTTRGEIKLPVKLPALFAEKAAVFVTISRNGRRRGCVGSFEAQTTCLRDEIVRAATAASVSDPRYRPIRSNELKHLKYTVSIVGKLRRVKRADSYPPARYGLLLRCGSKSGVLLPGEARTSSWRLAEARRQAGLRRGEPFELYVFETVLLR